MKEIWVETIPFGHLLQFGEAFIARNGLHLTELFAKEAHGNPQTTQILPRL